MGPSGAVSPWDLVTPLTEEIAVESSFLPGEFHGYPADRILVATARLMGGTIVTADQKILDYAKQQTLHAACLTDTLFVDFSVEKICYYYHSQFFED